MLVIIKILTNQIYFIVTYNFVSVWTGRRNPVKCVSVFFMCELKKNRRI